MTERDIFLAVLDLPDPRSRAEYLDQACGGDTDLRKRVEELLAAHPAASSFLEPDATGAFEAAAAMSTGAYQPDEPTATTAPAAPSAPADSPRAKEPLATTDHVPDSGSGDGLLPDTDTPAGEMPVVPGYQVMREIARGGMGCVLAARDLSLDRDVALKILLPGASADRFVRESKITARLPHPGIPPVHALGTLVDGSPFLAMKLIAGRTLADEMKNGDRPRLLQVFTQICQAVGFAHSRGIIHRDLKPANVMVGAFGEVQVMDWGLAKDLTGQETEGAGQLSAAQNIPAGDADPGATTAPSAAGQSTGEQTQAGQIMGTPAYMAPEQARGEATDARSDVFALGGILCAILTGQPPYSGRSTLEVIRRAGTADLAEAYARLERCGADAELIALCKTCLGVSPSDRPADAGVVAAAVADHQAAVDERARQAEVERGRAEEQRKRWRVQVALAGSVVLVLALAGFGVAIARLWRDAESARNDAEIQRGIADAGRLEEVRLRGLADGARNDAVKQKGIAEAAQAREAEANKALQREQDKLVVFEYGRTMEVAYQEWRDNNIVTMRALLNGTKTELRGWEWRHLDRLTDRSILTLKRHTNIVRSAGFNWDGSRLVTSSADRTAKVWDARTGAELLTLKGHTASVESVEFSPDGSQAVTGSQDGTARVWDAKTGAAVHTLKGHRAGVISASFSRDGSRVVTSSFDGTAKVWDAQTGASVLTLNVGTVPVWCARFSPAGSLMVTGSQDQSAKLWDAKTGAAVVTLKGDMGPVWAVSFSPDGSRVMTGSYDGTVKVWDAKTGVAVLTLMGHKDIVASVGFSPDGSRMITGSKDGTARVWDAKSGAELITFKGDTGPVWSANFSPDGSRVVTACGDRTARVWDAKSEAEGLTLRGHKTGVTSASFSADGSRVVTASGDRTAKVWDARTGVAVLTLQGHANIVTSAGFSPNGSRVVTGSWDGTAKVWDAGTGAELRTLKGHKGSVMSVVFNADGLRVVTGSSDGTAKVWDARSGTVLRTLSGGAGSVNSVGFSSDGTRVVMGADSRTAIVWDAQTGAKLLTLKGHAGAVTCASFSTDGSRVVTGSLDKTAKVWDAQTGAELLTLKGHTNHVDAAVFSPDGSRVVTGSFDMTAKVWDTGTGAELLTLKGHTSLVLSVCFSVDGSRVVTGSFDGTAKIWDSRPFRDTRPPDTEIAAASLPMDTAATIKVAALQVWFGKDKDYSATVKQALRFAKDTRDPVTAERTAKVCSLQSSTDKAHLDAALALGQRAVQLGEKLPQIAWFRMALGMAEYRSGNYAAAESALMAAVKGNERNRHIVQTSTLYRAMSWYRQGKKNNAAVLALGAVAAMKPLPKDRNNPLADGADADDLILWLAYQEAKALIRFESTPLAAGQPRNLVPFLEEVVKLHTAEFGPNHRNTLGSIQQLASAYFSAGQSQKALPLCEEIFKSRKAKLGPEHPDTLATSDSLALMYLAVAAGKAWFGQEQELAAICEKALQLAEDAKSSQVAERAAKACLLRPLPDKHRETVLALARRAVERGKKSAFFSYFQMTLGMAEYRAGHLAEADAALTAAMQSGKNDLIVQGTSAFYVAMSRFRQGKKDEAGKIAAEAASKMKPLPKDDKHPTADGANYNDLILWLAYKEAKALIGFEAAPSKRR